METSSWITKAKNFVLRTKPEIIAPREDQLFFKDGYHLSKFKKTETFKALQGSIKEVYQRSLKEGFSLEKKYRGSEDLRPNVYSYNDSFVDILIENNIPNRLEYLTGLPLTLAHIQLRLAHPSKRSYIGWHRDTHFYKDENFAGNTPPVHKLIFYPKIEVENTCLKVLPGSHIKYHDTLKEDLKFLKNQKENIVEIKSSESEFLIFNTGLLHEACPPPVAPGNLRLIYSFCLPSQIHAYPDEANLHSFYQSKLKEKQCKESSI